MSNPALVLEGKSTCVVPRSERRAAVRHAWSQENSCHLVTANRYEARWARVQDISTSGIGLLLNKSFEAGTTVLIELHGIGKGFARTLTARVVHASPQPDCNWLVGCQFLTPLSGNDLQQLLH